VSLVNVEFGALIDRPGLSAVEIRASVDGVIRFGPDLPPLCHYDDITWSLNEHHDVEFFPGEIISVRLISTEHSDFEAILSSYDDAHAIALDLEWETELCLFQFCSSCGIRRATATRRCTAFC
jgi:hypothetical protein